MKLYYLLPILMLLSSCANVSNDEKNSSETAKNKITTYKTGTITTKKLQFKDKTAQVSYYVPALSQQRLLPTVYFFDSHGEGAKTLARYQTIADSLQIILIASNELKNGLSNSTIDHAIASLLYTSFFRLPVDSAFICFAGFSGGGRIAVNMGQYSHLTKSLISCAAANPPDKSVDKRVSIVCGNNDFNYIECREVAAHNPEHISFYEFDGAHEWPPLQTMQTVLADNLDSSGAVRSKKINNDELILFAQEKETQQLLQKSYGTKDIKWWEAMVTELKKNAESQDKDLAQHSQRLVNYIAMISYFYCDNALKQNNKDLLYYCLLIYQWVAPENPDMYFYAACLNAMQGQTMIALKSIEKSLSLGLSEKEKLLSTPQLESLKKNDNFWAMVNSY